MHRMPPVIRDHISKHGKSAVLIEQNSLSEYNFRVHFYFDGIESGAFSVRTKDIGHQHIVLYFENVGIKSTEVKWTSRYTARIYKPNTAESVLMKAEDSP